MTKAERAARRLFREFREKKPGRGRWVKIDVPKAMTVIGRAVLIGYDTTHGRRAVPYTHEFAPGSRPLLVAGPKRGQIYLIGTGFKFTRRGIVDVDRSGRPVHWTPRYRVVRVRK